jgi:hypothetical protein
MPHHDEMLKVSHVTFLDQRHHLLVQDRGVRRLESSAACPGAC